MPSQKKAVQKAKASKETTNSKKPKETFSFGGMTKEERLNIISNALNVKPSNEPTIPWTVDETEYTPESWVVVLNTQGNIYQEPLPKYCNADYFVSLLAAMPDKLDKTTNRFTVTADEICKTEFKVKGVDCYINTVAYNGTRSINNFSRVFDIKNTTKNVGGNLVFSSLEGGFTKAQCKKVTEAIVKKLNTSEVISETNY